MQCDICRKDATDGWQHTYCDKCAKEVDADALESRLDDLTASCDEMESYQHQLRRDRADVNQLQRKVARLQRQLKPFIKLVALAREERDCGSPEARALFVTAAIEGCANLSVGDNALIAAPEDGSQG